MSNTTYKLSSLSPSPMAYVMALGMGAGLFLLLPLTQYFEGGGDDDQQLRRVNTTLPPPPIEFEEPPPIEEPPPETQVEELEQVQPEISLSSLGASLQAGVGGATVSTGIDFDTQPDTLEEMIFSIRDLDRVPRRISGRPPEYPFDLKRNKIEGKVRLSVIIDETGRVTVEKVVESTHRDFERPAIESAESSVFEKPTKDGKAVKIRYVYPFVFTLK
ncbi:MAG: energy transducer TonB [Opitutales bacterium]|nr:energy transducer TonB [Opitutales bacterium]